MANQMLRLWAFTHTLNTFKSVIFERVILESVKIFSKSVKMVQIVISENI